MPIDTSSEENFQHNNSVTVTTSLEHNRMIVNTSSNTCKTLFCKFCKKFQTKFARHCLTVLKDEEIIQQFVIFEPRDLIRKNE